MGSIRIVLLATGVLGGLAVALFTMLGHGDRSLPDYAVARVNDIYITRPVYERAVSALASDRRGALTNQDRRHVLNRLIDEELLIQHGVRQGLLRSDRRVKSTLVQSVMEAKGLEAEARDIPDAEARAFFAANQALFSGTGRVRVGLLRVAVGDRDAARERAFAAHKRLNRGEPFEMIAAEFHDGGILNLPDTPLPRSKLVDYLGPTLAGLALETAPGQAAGPVRIGQAWQLVYVHERIPPPSPTFETVRELVLAEMRRRAAEELVRGTLDGLRASESILVAEELH